MGCEKLPRRPAATAASVASKLSSEQEKKRRAVISVTLCEVVRMCVCTSCVYHKEQECKKGGVKKLMGCDETCRNTRVETAAMFFFKI